MNTIALCGAMLLGMLAAQPAWAETEAERGAALYLAADYEPGSSEYQLALGNVYGEKARTAGFFLSKKKWAGRWQKQLEMAFDLDPQNVDARQWFLLSGTRGIRKGRDELQKGHRSHSG